MLLKPIVTEKTIREAEKKRYTFAMPSSMTKPELKKKLEKLFKVSIIKIQTAIMPGKNYRKGRRWIYGQHADWKKTVITIKPDQKIELFDIPNQK